MLEILQPGLELMLLGMGTVFVFLSLLVVGMHAMSAVLARFSTPEEPTNTPTNDDMSTIAAIGAAAWHKHQQ